MIMLTSEGLDAAALAASIASATVLGADLKMGLYTNVLTPTKTLVVADFTEPTYGSYVRQAVLMGDPVRDPIYGIASVSGSLTWQQTGTAVPVTIVGCFLTFGAGNLFAGILPFDTPIALNDLLDAFDTLVEYVQSNDNGLQLTVVQ
jgi:hypothetical protein